MKNSKLFLLTIVAITLFNSACKKDSENPVVNDDRIVGEWQVDNVSATAYVDGFKVEGIEVLSDGTLEFKNDYEGYADFSLEFLGDQSIARGPFTWERDGFELVVKMADEVIRYAVIDDEDNLQRLQYTYKEDDSNDEVEFTFELKRSR